MNDRPSQENLKWPLAVARILRDRLGWSSTHLLVELLDHPTAVVAGADDGYNQTVRFDGAPDSFGNGWAVEGGCGYGSKVSVGPGHVLVASCGGHWVEARRIHSEGTRFLTDRRESQRSWADALCPECDGHGDDGHGDDCPECGGSGRSGLTGRDLSNSREAALEEAFACAVEAGFTD